MPYQRITPQLQLFARAVAHRIGHHRIMGAVGHEYRRFGVGRCRFLGKTFGQRQIGRQRHHAGERFRITQAGVQRDRAALRKTGEHDFATGRGAGNQAIEHGRITTDVANATVIAAAIILGIDDLIADGTAAPCRIGIPYDRLGASDHG